MRSPSRKDSLADTVGLTPDQARTPRPNTNAKRTPETLSAFAIRSFTRLACICPFIILSRRRSEIVLTVKMRVALLLLSVFSSALAFVPAVHKTVLTSPTQLDAQRRDVLITGIMGFLAAPGLAKAKGSTFFYDEKIEFVKEENQMPTGGKIDLNSAFVVCINSARIEQSDALYIPKANLISLKISRSLSPWYCFTPTRREITSSFRACFRTPRARLLRTVLTLRSRIFTRLKA